MLGQDFYKGNLTSVFRLFVSVIIATPGIQIFVGLLSCICVHCISVYPFHYMQLFLNASLSDA